MKKAVLTSFLADDIEAYISHKLSLGFVFDEGRRALASFDAMCASDFPGEVELTREVAMKWAGLRDGEHPNTRRGRVSAVRGLAEYMIRQGKPAYVIPRNSLAPASPYVPYIYTRDEIAALLEACDALAGGARPGESKLMLPCAVRLLYATGMRHGELRRLGRSDVDLGRGEISIGPSKTALGRTVYISDELCELLERFDGDAERAAPGRAYLFSRRDGGMRSKSWLQPHFAAAKCVAGIDEPGVAKRIHDLRHTFCVHRLNQWVHDGEDVRAMLPYLSAYVGHKTLAATDYYLHLVPEFFPDYSALVAHRNSVVPAIGGQTDE